MVQAVNAPTSQRERGEEPDCGPAPLGGLLLPEPSQFWPGIMDFHGQRRENVQGPDQDVCPAQASFPVVPPGRLERPHTAPEADALSAELRGHAVGRSGMLAGGRRTLNSGDAGRPRADPAVSLDVCLCGTYPTKSPSDGYSDQFVICDAKICRGMVVSNTSSSYRGTYGDAGDCRGGAGDAHGGA